MMMFLFAEHLKWAIRSQDPKPGTDKGMGKIQRLNGSGSEMASPHQRRLKI